MQFNLTFNKPAAALFEGASAVKVKADGKGKVMFKPSSKEGGRDTFPITGRTRGGLGIVIGGGFADQFLTATKMDRGTHMALEGGSYGWVHGKAVEGKPSKVVPTARLWRLVDESVSKAEEAPKRAPRKARAAKAEAAEGKRGTAGRAAANSKRTAAKKGDKPAASAGRKQAAKAPATRAPRARKQEATQQAAA